MGVQRDAVGGVGCGAVVRAGEDDGFSAGGDGEDGLHVVAVDELAVGDEGAVPVCGGAGGVDACTEGADLGGRGEVAAAVPSRCARAGPMRCG